MTHSVLCPELGSAGDHAITHILLIRAIELGFEIEGRLNEGRAARFAKEGAGYIQIG
jgi:hypothetical protein